MTVTLVCDPSDATELCASQRLYLKPVAKLTISVVFPEHTGPPRALSKLEVMDKLKNMICPDQFTSVKVSKSTKGFIRFEGEVETKHLVCSLKEKLHGKMIKLNGFKDSLQVVATEGAPEELPAPQEPEPLLDDGELLEEDFAEQSRDIPDCLRLEGLPCKWFALKGSDSEMPNEDVLRAVFEGFGKIKNIDIPMLDPYREETVGGNMNSFAFRGLRTFEAYVQYQEAAAFAKAMETLKGMKLMLKGEDGKAFACNIKVTSDTTNHFSESAINHRHLERLTLQGLERERKREENRAKRGTERKRRDDDDEKKVGEGKRKSKIKRREKRQIDRDDKRPRKQQKLTAGEALWPENMPEWEERKYLLAQRRVESIRLLTVLLSQIKDSVLSSRQTGEPLLSLANRREDCFAAPRIQNAPKETADFHYFGDEELQDEGELKCRSAQLGNTHFGGEEDEEQYVGTDQPASPRPLGRTVLNGPAARAVTSRLTDKDTDCCRGRGLLQVTVTQECKVAQSPDREDYRGLFSRVPNAGSCKKQKVYETEEFIHYLLNYYQTPRYARICPVTENVEAESWWQRVVSHSGDGFQVSLKSTADLCLTEVGFEPELPEEGSRDRWEVTEEEPGPMEVLPENRACHREFPPSPPEQWDDSLGETSDRTAHEDLNSPFLGSTVTARDGRPREDHTGAAAVRSRKSLGRVYKLKDLLEEISSDSECFSEALEPRSKMEKRNGGCRSSCKAWPLSRQGARELLICIQNVARGGQGGACSKRSFCCDLTKRPRQRLKAASKRSGSKVRREELKAKCPSSEEEKEACRKKKKKSAGNSLPHGNAHFFKTNHCGELESFGKMQRKCSKMLQQKTKCKTLHAAAGMGKAKDAIHLGASQLQEAHPEAGKRNAGGVAAGERGPDPEGRQKAKAVHKAGVKR